MPVCIVDGKKIKYEIMPSVGLDGDSTPYGGISVGSGVPEAYRDLIAAHEATEGWHVRRSNPPVVRRSLADMFRGSYVILDKHRFPYVREHAHGKACEKEIALAREKGILPEYAKWRIGAVKAVLEEVKAKEDMDPIEKLHVTSRLEEDIVLFGSEIW